MSKILHENGCIENTMKAYVTLNEAVCDYEMMESNINIGICDPEALNESVEGIKNAITGFINGVKKDFATSKAARVQKRERIQKAAVAIVNLANGAVPEDFTVTAHECINKPLTIKVPSKSGFANFIINIVMKQLANSRDEKLDKATVDPKEDISIALGLQLRDFIPNHDGNVTPKEMESLLREHFIGDKSTFKPDLKVVSKNLELLPKVLQHIEVELLGKESNNITKILEMFEKKAEQKSDAPGFQKLISIIRVTIPTQLKTYVLVHELMCTLYEDCVGVFEKLKPNHESVTDTLGYNGFLTEDVTQASVATNAGSVESTNDPSKNAQAIGTTEKVASNATQQPERVGELELNKNEAKPIMHEDVTQASVSTNAGTVESTNDPSKNVQAIGTNEKVASNPVQPERVGELELDKAIAKPIMHECLQLMNMGPIFNQQIMRLVENVENMALVRYNPNKLEKISVLMESCCELEMNGFIPRSLMESINHDEYKEMLPLLEAIDENSKITEDDIKSGKVKEKLMKIRDYVYRLEPENLYKIGPTIIVQILSRITAKMTQPAITAIMLGSGGGVGAIALGIIALVISSIDSLTRTYYTFKDVDRNISILEKEQKRLTDLIAKTDDKSAKAFLTKVVAVLAKLLNKLRLINKKIVRAIKKPFVKGDKKPLTESCDEAEQVYSDMVCPDYGNPETRTFTNVPAALYEDTQDLESDIYGNPVVIPDDSNNRNDVTVVQPQTASPIFGV